MTTPIKQPMKFPFTQKEFKEELKRQYEESNKDFWELAEHYKKLEKENLRLKEQISKCGDYS